MHETVFGFSKFIQNHPSEKLKIVYDIFGFGTAEEEALVKQAIVQTGLKETVVYHGRKTHQEIQEYYDTYNIGVTYVPKVDFFECQPPTKIFEYTNAGLYNIATSTFENKKLISQNNGVVCEDNVDSFAEALEEIYIKKESFSSQNIRKTLEEYSWENIVSKNLKKYFKDILNV
jgi:glycosyltransferase involved in cell wall biosynthesis